MSTASTTRTFFCFDRRQLRRILPFRTAGSVGYSAIVVLALVGTPTAVAMEVFQCDGPNGPTFSQLPCADDALVRRVDVPRPARTEPLHDTQVMPLEIDAIDGEDDAFPPDNHDR